MTKGPVRLQLASLDDKGEEVVAHGWLDIEAINNLHVAGYQREVLTVTNKKSPLRRAVENGVRLPDVMLGMRGDSFSARGETMTLENDVYIVDGLQRLSALKKFAEDYPEEAKKIRIGAEVRFNTTNEKEVELFTALNVHRRAMSPNVILRNARNKHFAVANLYGLSESDKNFAAHKRVSWNQQMHRGELFTALVYAKVAMTLHRHMSTGGRNVHVASYVPETLDRMSTAAGLFNFRNNVFNYFKLLDEVWGLRGVNYQDKATHVRSNFVIQLAGVLADHEEFWDGNKLVLDPWVKAKLRSFPVDDPTIARMASGGVSVGELLRRMMIDHFNKRRPVSKHLKLKRTEISAPSGGRGRFKLG